MRPRLGARQRRDDLHLHGEDEAMSEIHAYVKQMVDLGASDLHLTPGHEPLFRVDGDIRKIEGGQLLDDEQLTKILFEIAPQENVEEFEQHNDTDFALEVPGVGRLRANLYRDKSGVSGAFRIIPNEVMSLEELGLPNSVEALCSLNKGLVLVTGPTGSGKSTTLAAMINHINDRREDHVITIEDPIEYMHDSKRCLVHQRELHRHTGSSKRALRSALREDPDIVLVGEMRDLETVEMAIETAETGHLVFGTLHTTTAASTVDRVIDIFPADRQSQIRSMLSSSLKGVVAQMLCKRKKGGRVAAFEILLGNTAIATAIREGKTHQIPSTMQLSQQAGMRMLNDSLMHLLRDRTITAEEAWRRAIDKKDIENKFQAAGVTANRRRQKRSSSGATEPIEESPRLTLVPA
jgi:twitching motility protein PilT